ncbi:O-antigen ligase family protein [Roseospira visakhapatnamensis]|uniref:O-antigen ligase n=1 Tax=Roseospira visakhapatnamensis TaxID=390880 RepID=A0A7W6RDE5_9PROT|nr:O-antigen ligase family protein [Roseospira visakhapatnamensis]MBB4266438.1 O-antigen ligase [Roseospira visakhapatnamensis]
MVSRPVLVLCVLLAWAPLPLASNRPWSWALLLAGVFVLAAWTLWRDPDRRRPWSGAQCLALAGFGGVLAWALVQAAPGLGASWAHWRDLAALTGRVPWGSVSLDPWATAEGAVRLAGYATAAWLGAVLVGPDPVVRRGLVRVLATTGAVLAAYALAVLVSGTQTIGWIEKWTYHDVATATFVNRNAYAVYAGIGVAAAALAAGEAETRWGRRLWGAVVALGMVAVVFTESRWGLASVLAGLAVLVLARPPGWGRPWRRLLAGAALVPWLPLLLLATGRGRWLERLDPAHLVGDLRWDLYRVTGAAILEAPWTGHGLGTFPVLYHRLRDDSLADHLVLQAHSVPLELAADLGIPAALALMAAFVALALGSWAGARASGDPLARLAVAAAVVVGLHGLLDFSLHMPAVAVTILVLLGAGSSPTSGAGRGAAPAHAATASPSAP